MTVTAAQVKQLRDKTGAGMMDCKKALTESEGDFEAATEWLRKKGLSQAAKKSGRTAAEGLVTSLVDGKKGAIVEVNSETDFVAKNEQFQKLVSEISKLALASKDVESLKQQKCESGRSVEEEITESIAVIGENINLRRMSNLEVENGKVYSYVHNALAPGMGKIAVLVALESDLEAEKLDSLGKQLAMHIAASRPEVMYDKDVSHERVEKEKQIIAEQLRNAGKKEERIEKDVEKRIKKFYEEVALMNQTFIMDNKTPISKLMNSQASQLGGEIKIAGFECFELGEGIETEQTNLAEEVAKATGK
jgi:elongation factor Ts